MSRRARHDWFLSRLHTNRRRARSGCVTTNSFPYHRRLRIEPLEARQLLSSVTVGNALDVVNGNTSSIVNLIATPGADGIALREAVLAANATAGADTILFSTPFSITLGGTEIEITEALTIDARPLIGNVAIYANQASRIFNITATTGDFTFGALTLLGGRNVDTGTAGGGGAIRSLTNGNLIVSESIIIGNTAGGKGGGIFAAGNVTFNDSNVENNQTTMADAPGGGVYTAGNAMLTRSKIRYNVSSPYINSHGGGLFAAGNVTLTASAVSGNRTIQQGGAIFAEGDVTLNDSAISGNTSEGFAGGVQGENVILNRSTVSGNQSNAFAGGVQGTNVTLNHSTVTGNRSSDGGGGVAGGDVMLDHSTVNGNTSGGEGGGILAGKVTLVDSIVSDNHTSGRNSSGGGIYASSNVTLTRSTVSGNSTSGYSSLGGGIYIDGNFIDAVTITQSTVSGNRTSGERAFGGGIASRSNVVVLDRSTVSGNRTSGENAVGGGIFAVSDVTVTHSTVSDNSTSDEGARGGGIYTLSDLMLTSSTVHFNSTYGINAAGGGLWAVDNVTIVQSTISGNETVRAEGAGIYCIEGAISISRSTITGNIAVQGSGGGLFQRGSADNPPVTISGSILSANLAGNAGADLIVDPQSILDVNYSLIGTTIIPTSGANNLVADDPQLGPLLDHGGLTMTHAPLNLSLAVDQGDPAVTSGVDQRGFPFLRVVDGNFFPGARIDIGAHERQTIPGLTLVVSTASDVVDGDYSAGNLSLREAIGLANGSFGPNTINFAAALTSGGPATIVLTRGQLTISDSLTIVGPGDGLLTIDASGNDEFPEFDGFGSRVFDIDDHLPGVMAVSISGVTLTGGDLSQFDDERSGGAIYNAENLTLSSSRIVNNAAFDGGGIASDGPLTIVDSTLSDNVAVYGGAISHNSANLTITGSTLNGNSANQGGAMLSETTWGSTLATITNTTISGNTASIIGGGLFNGIGATVIRHSTITNNSAPANAGGGVATRVTNSTVQIHSSIVAANTQGSDVVFVDGAGNPFASLGYNVVGTGNGLAAFNLVGDQPGVTNPMLGPLAANGGISQTHALLPGSPTIDKGEPAAVAGGGNVPLYDQRGIPFARVYNGDVVPGARIDIGAFEVQPLGPMLPGDYNQNNVVDAADYVFWRNTLTQTVPAFSGADGDGNGTIGQGDLNVWRARFGQTLGSASEESAAVSRLASMPGEETQPQPSSNLERQAGAAIVTTIAHPRSASAAPFLRRPPALGAVTAAQLQSMPASSSLALITAPHDDALLAWLASRHLQQERAAGEWSIRPDDPEEESADREVRSESLDAAFAALAL